MVAGSRLQFPCLSPDRVEDRTADGSKKMVILCSLLLLKILMGCGMIGKTSRLRIKEMDISPSLPSENDNKG